MALKAREATLNESEDKYRQLAETSHDIIVTVDLNFKITYTNKAALNFTGVIDPVGVSLIDFTPQHLRPLQEEIMQKRREGFSDMLAFEWEIIHPTGKLSTFDIRATLLTEDRKPSGVMFVARDITERKRTEEELRERTAKMDSIFRAAPTGIGVVSNRILVEVNQRICEMTGYSREELVGKSARILYPTQEDFDFVGTEKYRQIQLQGTGSVETKWRRKNGTIIDIILSSTPVDTGELSAGVTFIALDITESKKADKALRRSEERYRGILEEMEEAYYEVDLKGNFTFFNESMCKMLGYSRVELMGMSNRAYTSPETVRKTALIFTEIYRTGNQTTMMDYEIIRKNGEKRTLEASVSLIKKTSGEIIGYRGVLRDITERKIMEKAQEKS
jgi:PAS domain S-box-containing protein